MSQSTQFELRQSEAYDRKTHNQLHLEFDNMREKHLAQWAVSRLVVCTKSS